MKLKISYLFLFFVLSSCSLTIEQKWNVTSFSKLQKFTISVSEEKNTTNVNIYLKSDVKDTLYLGQTKNDTIIKYYGDSTEKMFFVDFYGGDFDLYLFPTNTSGYLDIKIEVPYH